MGKDPGWMFSYVRADREKDFRGPYATSEECLSGIDTMCSIRAVCSPPEKVPEGHTLHGKPFIRPERAGRQTIAQYANNFSRAKFQGILPYLQAELEVVQNVMDSKLACKFLRQLPERIMEVVVKEAGPRDLEGWDEHVRETFSLGRGLFLARVAQELEEQAGRYSPLDGDFLGSYKDTLSGLISRIKEII